VKSFLAVIILIFPIVCFSKTVSSPNDSTMNISKIDTASGITPEEQIYTYVEEMPLFPGGVEAMTNFIYDNLRYPAGESDISGKIHISFIVTSVGGIADVKIVKGLSPGLNGEAVRVVASMPKWTPGKQNGKPVAVKICIPIEFKLQ
jgi:periplasmic protein TonB